MVVSMDFFPKFTKLCLIVKKKFLKDAKNKSISTDGRKHLGAVVGSDTYKVWYVKDLVNDWNTQLKFLTTPDSLPSFSKWI